MNGQSPEIEPMYAWQVLDDDGRWGTVMVFLNTPVNAVIGNDEKGHNLVLCHRNPEIARGPMKEFAEMHAKATGKQLRLHRFIPDPDFEPEAV